MANLESQKLTKIKTIWLQFDIPLSPHNIHLWRGAVAEAAGWGQNLFHNHRKDSAQNHKTYYYRYPAIHYRVWKRKAAIFGIGEGTEALKDWIQKTRPSVRIGNHHHALRVIDRNEEVHTLQMCSELRVYRLMDWMALHKENYKKWLQAETLVERILLLERVLAGQVLGFARAMEFELPDHLEVSIFNLNRTRSVVYKGEKQLAFNLLFKANIELPQKMAIGRSISHGFGVLHPVKSKNSL
jgi:hypothetical protein